MVDDGGGKEERKIQRSLASPFAVGKACPDGSTTGRSFARRNKFQFVVALCVQVVCVAKVLPVVPCISQKQEKNAFACVCVRVCACVCVCVCDMVTQEKRE
jgi:hypothetical protein